MSLFYPICFVPRFNVGTRRTYSDEHQGQIVREGFEPQDLKAESSKSSAVVDDDDDDGEDGGVVPEDTNEALHWSQSDDSKGEASGEGKARFGSLGDGNVWRGHSGS